MTGGRVVVPIPALSEPLRTAFAVNGGLAVLSAAAGLAAGRPALGGAVALGLVLGSGNGVLARSLVQPGAIGIQVVTAVLMRLAFVSLAAIGVGLLFGVAVAPLVLAGVGIAQLALAASAAWRGVRS